MQQDEKTLVRRDVEFTKFRASCEAREREGTWSTEFARALSLGLVDAGCSPGELARRTGRSWKGIWRWTSGKCNPRKKTAATLERELDMRPGSLVSLAGANDKATGERMDDLWDDRRHSAGTLAKRKKRMMAGQYTKSVPISESLEMARAVRQEQGYSQGPTSLQGRVKKALWRVCFSDHGEFVECLGCRKPIYRPNCLVSRGATHWHKPCWNQFQVGRPRGSRLARKSGPSAIDSARMVLMSDGLGLSAGRLSVPNLESSKDRVSAAQAVRMTLVRGRKYLDGLLWGELFPAKGKKPSNIHKVLKDFPVKEVLEIAAGTHPLSKVTDVESAQKWFPANNRRNPLDGYSVTDTALAILISNVITERFPSVYAAAIFAGTTNDTLTGIMSGGRRKYWRHTWAALATLTGVPEVELRALNSEPVAETSNIGS